jgi:hypothetical protein
VSKSVPVQQGHLFISWETVNLWPTLNSKRSFLHFSQDHNQRIFFQLSFNSVPPTLTVTDNRAALILYLGSTTPQGFGAVITLETLRAPTWGQALSVQKEWVVPLHSGDFSWHTSVESSWWHFDLVYKQQQLQTLESRHFPPAWQASLSELTGERQSHCSICSIQIWLESNCKRQSSSKLSSL